MSDNPYKDLASRLHSVSKIFIQNPDQLIPFDRGKLNDELTKLEYPSLNFGITGFPDIIGLNTLSSTFIDFTGDFFHLDIFKAITDLMNFLGTTKQFLGQQFTVTLSLFIVLDILEKERREALLSKVNKAYQEYFFKDDGFVTLDELHILPPTLVPEDMADLPGLKSFFSQKTADQCVRRMIQVTTEAVGDELFDLDIRYKAFKKTLTEKDKRMRWFKGLSSLAESSVTSAVEQGAQGAGTFSTSPLLAASLGTFAGTAARKATQHIFLEEIGFRQSS
jgi:hypothetical protein